MASLISNIEMIQGTSSDIYTISSDDYATFDSDWVANLVIRELNITGEVKISRTVPKNDGTDGMPVDSRFVFQITPSESDLLGKGKFYISIEIRNDVKDFNREVVQCPLSITASGI